jgi:hypothetical protein
MRSSDDWSAASSSQFATDTVGSAQVVDDTPRTADGRRVPQAEDGARFTPQAATVHTTARTRQRRLMAPPRAARDRGLPG